METKARFIFSQISIYFKSSINNLVKECKGFSMIEMITVMAIMGIILTLVTVNVNKIRIDSRNAKRISDMQELKTALERYYSDSASYPTSSAGFGWDGVTSCWGYATPDWIKGIAPNYIAKLPSDPKKNTNNCSEPLYIYRSNGTDYKIIAHRPDNCVDIGSKYPHLIDPNRGTAVANCSFGYWTPGATGY